MSEKPTYDIEDAPETPDQKLIRLLKEKGPEDEEARATLFAWLDERERIIDEATTGRDRTMLTALKERDLGKIYLAAGFERDGLKALCSAAVMLSQILPEGRNMNTWHDKIAQDFPVAEQSRIMVILAEVQQELDEEAWPNR